MASMKRILIRSDSSYSRWGNRPSEARFFAKLGSSNSDDCLEFSCRLEARVIDASGDVTVDGGQRTADLEGCWRDIGSNERAE